MAEWIVENWFIIVALAAVAGGVACAIYKFPVAAKIVSFATFSMWVDEALESMRAMLKTNKSAQEYVSGDTQ